MTQFLNWTGKDSIYIRTIPELQNFLQFKGAKLDGKLFNQDCMSFYKNLCLVFFFFSIWISIPIHVWEIRKIKWPFGIKKLSKCFSYWNILVLLQFSYLIYHEFYQLSAMVYDCFRNYYIYIYMLWSIFRVFSGSCMFWSNVEIMEHFGAKDRRNS